MSSDALSMTVNNSQKPITFQKKQNPNVFYDQFSVVSYSPGINQNNPISGVMKLSVARVYGNTHVSLFDPVEPEII